MAVSTPTENANYESFEQGLDLLPAYARSLLKVKVCVCVTIASTTQPIGNIVNFGPGAVIQFNKSCEDTLSLEVANQVIALGEAVKIGETYGLKVTEVVMPQERFTPVRKP